MIARGGKQIYGAPVGILMLDARFPRIPGDMGNAATWPFPVLYGVVEDASPDLVVRGGAEGMLQPFIDAGRRLIRQGAEMITTNCGFLSLFQAELSAALRVPVASSALMQVPFVQALLPPGQQVGIITISARSLTAEHLARAGCDPDIHVVGTDDGEEFSHVILDDCLELDIEKARRDLVAAGRALTADRPEVGAIVLECTNMPPYQADVQAATQRMVFSMVDYVCWIHRGLRPPAY